MRACLLFVGGRPKASAAVLLVLAVRVRSHTAVVVRRALRASSNRVRRRHAISSTDRKLQTSMKPLSDLCLTQASCDLDVLSDRQLFDSVRLSR